MDHTKQNLHDALAAYLAANWPGNELADDAMSSLVIPLKPGGKSNAGEGSGTLEVPILFLRDLKQNQEQVMPLKLFIWADPYHVNYGSSMLLVVAHDVDEARKLAKDGRFYSYVNLGSGEPPANAPVPDREPDRIVECPCAEFHEWSE